MGDFNRDDYETVDSRIKRFYGDHPAGRILTELVSADGDVGKTRWVVKASVWRDRVDGDPDGTGFAFEVDGQGMTQRVAALETGETSAIGRALANIGYSGDKRASREEMGKAKRMEPESAPAPLSPPDGWREALALVRSPGLLQEYYEQEARKWFTPEVRAAFTARKSELEAV